MTNKKQVDYPIDDARNWPKRDLVTTPNGLADRIINKTKAIEQKNDFRGAGLPSKLAIKPYFKVLATSIVFAVFVVVSYPVFKTDLSVSQGDNVAVVSTNVTSVSDQELLWQEVMLLQDELLFDQLENIN